MVAEVGVHDDDKSARGELQAVNVGGAEAELARARLEDDVRRVGLYELVGDFLRAVGGSVVDDDELPVELAAGRALAAVSSLWWRRGRGMLPSYLSVKVRFSNHAMMGRFLRSLYVGRMTEYFSLEALAGAIVSGVAARERDRRCRGECGTARRVSREGGQGQQATGKGAW